MKLESRKEIKKLQEEFDRSSPAKQRKIIFKRLYEAYLRARKGKTRTYDEAYFEKDLIANLNALTDEIMNGEYRPSRGVAFVIMDPVVREIFAAKMRDRVIHHFLHGLSGDYADSQFIDDSYSCRLGKGTDYGIKRLYKHVRKVSKGHTKEVVVLKFDLLGYFMSLPHKELYQVIKSMLIKQFGKDSALGKIALFLWRQVIFDDPVEGATFLGKKEDWAKVPPSKSLLCQPKGRGIVIGNLTSQLLSNIYLNLLDQFIKNVLGIKAYGRYVDDFYIVLLASEVEAFRRDKLPLITEYITGLKLTLHPRKQYCQPVKKGVPFLGVRVYEWHLLPDRRTAKNFHKIVQEVAAGERGFESIESCLGRLQHLDSQKLIKKEWSKNGWDYNFSPSAPWSGWYT